MHQLRHFSSVFRSITGRVLVLLLLSWSNALFATELINDGWSDGQTAVFQGGFISGEIGAARFVPDGPCPCFVKQVTLLYGGASATRTVRVHVWEDGAGAWTPLFLGCAVAYFVAQALVVLLVRDLGRVRALAD